MSSCIPSLALNHDHASHALVYSAPARTIKAEKAGIVTELPAALERYH
jgi:hypothetical protein